MHHQTWRWTLFTALAIVLSSSSAWAQDTEMGGEEDMIDVDDAESDAYQQMLELSAEGNEHYAAGRIEEAAATYEKAYELHPQPILLKNQMITRFLLEECDTAIDLGEHFLATGEDSAEDRKDVKQVFGNCAYTLADEAADDENYTRAQEWLDFGEPYFYQAGNEDDARALRDDVDRRIADVDDSPDDVDAYDDDGTDVLTLTGWSLTGVGALTMASAGIWTLRWNRQVSAMEAAETRTEFDDKQADLIESYDTARWGIPTLWGVGLTAAAAGVGLVVWSSMDDDDSSAMLHPTWNGDGAGAAFSVSF